MSLINQMLRDLKVRKEADAPGKTAPLRANISERIPYLPLPLVLGSVALLLVCLIWWLSGALSDSLFRFEPATGGPVVRQETPVPATEAVTAALVKEDREMLTVKEQAAEPAAPAVITPVLSESPAAVKPQSLAVAPRPEPEPKAPAVKARSTARPASVAQVTVEAPAPQVVARPTLAMRVAEPTPSRPDKPSAPSSKLAAPSKLHPDDLPGALLSTSREIPARDLRPATAVPLATSPYGVAEQAYLDGLWARDQRRQALATRSLQQALAVYPGHLPARTLLAEIQAQEGKSGEAMFLLAEGLEIAPDYSPFKKHYARLLLDQGDAAAAAQVLLNKGLPTVEEDPEIHVILASVYQRLGEHFLAAQTYRNLLVAWPQTGAFWVGLGGALEAQRLSEEAMECYRRALATDNLRRDLNDFARRRLGQLD